MTARRREAWEAQVASFLAKDRTPRARRATLGVLASLLDKDMLPLSGRAFLAKYLRAVSNGADPRSILPRGTKKRGHPALDFLVAVEREKLRVRAAHGDLDEVYLRVGKRFDITAGTVQKQASIGRKHLRSTWAENLAAGADREALLKALAAVLKLPPAVIENLTFSDPVG